MTYLERAKIDLNRITDSCSFQDYEKNREVCYNLFMAVFSSFGYDKQVVDERGKKIENENELLAYLYRVCGLNSRYLNEDGNGVVLVYIEDYLSKIDIFAARNAYYEGRITTITNQSFDKLDEEINEM